MTPTEIKIKLIQRGITQTDIARRAGRSVSAVSMVINGKMKSRPIVRVLARAIGVKIEELNAEAVHA